MKLSEMREKTVDELKQFVEESKKQLLNFRIQIRKYCRDF